MGKVDQIISNNDLLKILLIITVIIIFIFWLTQESHNSQEQNCT